MMALNGCSKMMCPLQVGAADNCTLTKEQCPYFTQDIDYHRVLKQIKVEVAEEIFDDILKIKGLELHDWEAIFELKKKYTDGR